MIGTHTDISALKAVQSALERSQDFLELIIDTVPQAIFWQDRDFRYLGCNERFRGHGRRSATGGHRR